MAPSTSTSEPRSAGGFARRTLGIVLLLVVVVLWTASNFLASTIFADDTYSKPFFVTYVNTSCFILPLSGILIGRVFRLWRSGRISRVDSFKSLLNHIDSHDSDSETQSMMRHGEERDTDEDPETWNIAQMDSASKEEGAQKLGLKGTARLSLQFCMLWFLANYFAMGCLQFTTVGSTTILTSTSGVWTLIFGALLGVERFTLRKCAGVVASLIGIILISRVDLSGPSPSPSSEGSDNNNHGTFPTKSTGEIALGDAMAGFSAMMYGIYTIVLKKQVGDESRVNMQLFFGLVGFFNVFLLWPGFVILHFTGLETFALPDTKKVWTIILVNSVSSLLSDICWAYAMLLTTPLVVTVGLSLTIPLSLVGQIVLQGQYASPLYWVGAAVVFLSFLVVNHESKDKGAEEAGSRLQGVVSDGGVRYDAVPADEGHR